MSFESTQLTLLQGHASLPKTAMRGAFRHLYHHIACPKLMSLRLQQLALTLRRT